MLNGFDRMLIFGASLSPLLSRPSVLSRRVIEQSSGSSSSESSPTTSICMSSSSRSDSLLIRCCAKYSAFSVSISTVMPFARSLRACRSNALDNFFRRRALEKRNNEKKELVYIFVRPIWIFFSNDPIYFDVVHTKNEIKKLTFLLLSIRSVELVRRNMIADVHCALVYLDLFLCALSYAI